MKKKIKNQIMYQVLSIFRGSMNNRVEVMSHHLSPDIEEARRVFETVKEGRRQLAKDESIRYTNLDENLMTIGFQDDRWESVGLNEIEVSDGELLTNLN